MLIFINYRKFSARRTLTLSGLGRFCERLPDDFMTLNVGTERDVDGFSFMFHRLANREEVARVCRGAITQSIM